MSYEDILNKAGDFGLYQKLLCAILVFYTTFLCGLNYYTQIFIFSTPNHRCQLSHIDGLQREFGADWDQVRPWIPVEQGYSSKCEAISINNSTKDTFEQHAKSYFANLFAPDPDAYNHARDNVLNFVDNVDHKQCDEGWVYDHRMIFNTITSDSDWVCQDDWKPLFIQTIFWVGNTVGCCLWGFTNDYWGRKPTVLITHSVYFLAGIATIFAKDFVSLSICRFLVGSAHHTVSHLPYLLVVEYCGVKSRTFPLLMVMVSYSVASMTVPWLAFALNDWKQLAVIGSVLILPIIAGYKLIPESPSWLLVKGRTEEAKVILKRVAKINGTIEDDDSTLFSEKELFFDETPDSKASLLTLFKTPNLRMNALRVNIICMMGYMCYYGHVQNTSNLGDNHYMNYFLGALVEIPCWSIPFLINKLGRRWPLLVLFTTSGVCGVAYGFVPEEFPWVSMTVALVGRLTVNAAYFICLQYASEIFPTVIRGQGIAMCEIVGGIAIFLSPSVVYLAKVSPVLPLLILGVCSIAGALATFFLPETAQKSLPQTMEDGRDFGTDQSLCYCICKKSTNRYDGKNSRTAGKYIPEDEPIVVRLEKLESALDLLREDEKRRESIREDELKRIESYHILLH